MYKGEKAIKNKLSIIGLSVILIIAFTGIAQAGPIDGSVVEVSVGESGTVLKIKRASDDALIAGIVDADIANQVIAVALTAKSIPAQVRGTLKGPDGTHSSQWWKDLRILE